MSLVEALVDYNMHFLCYGSFGVLVQPEGKNGFKSRQRTSPLEIEKCALPKFPL